MIENSRPSSPIPTTALLWSVTFADSLTMPTQKVTVVVLGASSMPQACAIAQRGPTIQAFESTYPNAVPVQVGVAGIIENP
jgi:hypothetical protein